MRNHPWLPVIIPLIVFPVVGLCIVGLGTIFLQIAYATGEWFHAPYPHSMMVIVVALIFSGLIALGCWLYARPRGSDRVVE